MSNLDARTVLITGAAGGIGQALCRLFAGRGARIAALDVNSNVMGLVEELLANGHVAAGAVADITLHDELKVAIDELREQLGPIEVLINNAGYSSCPNLESTTAETWQADVNLNLNGAFNCTHNVLGDMKTRGSGSIINISSVNGTAGYGDPAYSAAKAGLINYTKSLAMEYGRFGIRANVICPGTVRTPIWDHRTAKDPTIFDKLLKWYPLRRVADPADIAKVAAFLASDDAAAISGAMLPVDCGLTAGNIAMTREITKAEY